MPNCVILLKYLIYLPSVLLCFRTSHSEFSRFLTVNSTIPTTVEFTLGIYEFIINANKPCIKYLIIKIQIIEKVKKD